MHTKRLNWSPLAPCASGTMPHCHINLDSPISTAVAWHNCCRTDLCAQMDVVRCKLVSEISFQPLPSRSVSSTASSKARGNRPSILGFLCPAFWERLNKGKRELRSYSVTRGREWKSWLQSQNHQTILNGIVSKWEGSCLWNTTRISTGTVQLLIIYIVQIRAGEHWGRKKLHGKPTLLPPNPAFVLLYLLSLPPFQTPLTTFTKRQSHIPFLIWPSFVLWLKPSLSLKRGNKATTDMHIFPPSNHFRGISTSSHSGVGLIILLK